MSGFGQILRKLRKKAKMTQKVLAKALHISKSAVSGYEQGWRFPSIEILVNIADIFHVSVDYLLGREQKCRVLYIDGLKDEDIEFLLTVIFFLKSKNRMDGKILVT